MNPEFDAMIDSCPLAIVSYDPEGVVTFWNPAAEKVFGWTPEEAVGKRLPFVPADKQSEFEELRKRALRGEAFLEPELHRRRADGSPIVVSASTAPLRDTDGAIYGILEILSDVTERKAREESQACILAAMEQAGDSVIVTDARGMILYVNAAFERVSGFRRAEVIGRKPAILNGGRRNGEFYRKLWEAIGRGETWRGTVINRAKDGTLFEEDTVISTVRDPAGRIVSYVGIQRDVVPSWELADPATRDKGGIPSPDARLLFQPRPLDLDVVLSDMERVLRRLAGKKIDLSLVPGRNLGKVKAEPGKVEQLIAGLALHARHTMPGGGRLTVKTANVDLTPPSYGPPHEPEVPPGRYILLSFEGNGDGTDREFGVGTADAREIVRRIDGHVHVECTGNQTVGFHVYLPRLEESAEERLSSAQRRRGSLSAGTETVLLVEDEDVVRLAAGEILRTCGYTVIEARNGKEALNRSEAHEGKIDMALTDVVMPMMDGLELSNRLQATRPDTRILFMSGYTDKDMARMEDPEKGIAFIRKPFTAEALALKIREVLDVA